MDNLQHLASYLLHLDNYLIEFVAAHGTWTYLAAFLVIFCETGLIVLPFLPGDSLLFALGSIAAHTHNPLNILILLPLLILASILGNQVNYMAGRFVGPKIFSLEKHWLFNKKHLDKAHQFYEQQGGKTIILARFMPIVRTFVPFVAGVCYMTAARFNAYNIGSAILWIGSLLGMGYFLGSLPIVKDHFSIVIYGIVAISLVPPVISFFSHKNTSAKSQ